MGKKIPYLFKTYETEDYLKTAGETAEWINEQEVTGAEGIIWKTFPDGQPGLTGSSILSDTSFYAGSAGIGFFFLRLYQVTQDKKWLEKAELAADYLLSKEKDISFEISEPAKQYILDKGTNIKFGARPLRRTIQSVLEDKLAEEILDGNLKKNKLSKIGVKDEEVVVL